jgi:hypothetical protein
MVMYRCAYGVRVRYTAFGEGSAALNCTTEKRQNDGWEEAGTPWRWEYTGCSPVSTNFEASEMSGVA